MILSVASSPSIDKLFEVQRLTPGDIHRPEHFVPLAGGKGIHVAQVATALGAAAVVMCVLAGNAGRWVAGSLAAEGVDGRFVWAAGETRSSLSVADRETGRLTEFYEDGAPIDADDWRMLERMAAGLLGEARWLSLAGSLPPGSPVDAYCRLIGMARDVGVYSAVDSRSAALAMALQARPDFVKINEYEAAELLGRPIDSGVESWVRAAQETRARAGGDGHASVITMGEEGMVLIEPSGAVWRGRLYVRGRYPVGSGDALLGGMLVALDRGDSWSEAMALGLGAAAANAEIPGAGRIDPARATELAAAAEIEALGC
jgi:1-phosphofructokinase family hexose kinase